MAKEIRYTMTSKEALLKAVNLAIAANIPDMRFGPGSTPDEMREEITSNESEGVSLSLSFKWERAFAICVTMYVEFDNRWHLTTDQPVTMKVRFSYSGTTHDLSSAMAINDLHQKVVALGATIDAVLDRETIKPPGLSWQEERNEATKHEARDRYQDHLTRNVGTLVPIGSVHEYDIGFSFKTDSKTKKDTFICGASKGNSPICCGNTAKHAIWIGKSWAARCGRHKAVTKDTADPIADILVDYEKDYGKKFLNSKEKEAA
jgi:hypothetical protein